MYETGIHEYPSLSIVIPLDVYNDKTFKCFIFALFARDLYNGAIMGLKELKKMTYELFLTLLILFAIKGIFLTFDKTLLFVIYASLRFYNKRAMIP